MDDDDFTILAAPVPDPAVTPTDAAGPDAPILPFAPPEGPAKSAPLLLLGYDSPGDEFQPRLRSSNAA